MLNKIKQLIGVHQKGDATFAEIEDALEGARVEIGVAERAGAAADRAYRDGLLRLDEGELEKLIAARQSANVRRDRASALVSALTERLASARIAEDQAERRTRYEAAGKAQAAAAKVLSAEYPKLARGLAALLRTIAEADALAAKANEALPDGAERLPSVESRVRREPNVPGRITRDEVFSAWCGPNGYMLSPENAAKVEADPDGTTGVWKVNHQPPITVTLRRFRRVTTAPDATGRDIAPLASTLNLPALGARHKPFWPADAASGPAGILAWLDENAPDWGKPFGPAVIDGSAPKTEIIPLDEAAKVAA